MLGIKALCLVVITGCIALFAIGVGMGDTAVLSYPGLLLAATIVILPIHVVGQFRAATDHGWIPDLPGERRSQLRLVAFVAAWLAAIWLMPLIGFIAAATVGVCASLGALGGYRLHLTLPVVFATVVGIFALVERVLYIPMPRGPLEDAIGSFLYRLAQGG